jgi:hypothetical protein
MRIDEQEKAAYWCRCSIGKDKWFWITYDGFDAIMDERPTAYGTARTSEAAETDAKDSLLREFGDYDTNPLPANWARNAYRKGGQFTLLRRAPFKPQETTNPAGKRGSSSKP